MKKNIFKKTVSLCLIITLIFSLTACGDKKKEKPKITEKEKKYVTSAIDEVTNSWKNIFSVSEGKPQSAEIVGTRLIKIKKNDIEDFKDVEAIVDFNLMTGPYGDASYYSGAKRDNTVVFYKDGTTRVFNVLNSYFAKKFDNKFGGVIDKVIDLGSDFNTKNITVRDVGTGEDASVKKAVDALKAEWTKQYKKTKVKDDFTLNIVNTQLIKVHVNNSYKNFKKYFKNISCIVEFEINTNYMDTAPYYMYTEKLNNVIIYKDGTTKVVDHYIDNITAKTYSFDFKGAIETVPLGSKYNENVKLEVK